MTQYEPSTKVEFVVVRADMATRLTITLERTAAGAKLTWPHLFTGLTGDGNLHIGHWTAGKDRALSGQLDYYLRTGKMLRATSGG